MNKEKLIAAMLEAVYSVPTDNAENECLIGIGWERIDRVTELCAESAITLMSREWVRVEDSLPLPIYSTVGKISKYVPFITLDDKEWFGYYDYIGKVWQAKGFKTFRKDEVKSWFNLPTPPKQ